MGLELELPTCGLVVRGWRRYNVLMRTTSGRLCTNTNTRWRYQPLRFRTGTSNLNKEQCHGTSPVVQRAPTNLDLGHLPYKVSAFAVVEVSSGFVEWPCEAPARWGLTTSDAPSCFHGTIYRSPSAGLNKGREVIYGRELTELTRHV